MFDECSQKESEHYLIKERGIYTITMNTSEFLRQNNKTSMRQTIPPQFTFPFLYFCLFFSLRTQTFRFFFFTKSPELPPPHPRRGRDENSSEAGGRWGGRTLLGYMALK